MMSKYSSNFSGSLAEPGPFLFTRTMYDKGAWVLHMLRWEVGDSSFFEILRNYYEAYKYSNASISDFKYVCEKVSVKNLDKFFEQWIYVEGQIELKYKTETVKSQNEYLNRIQLGQIQEDYKAYHFPLEVKLIFEDSTEKSFRYEITSKDTLIEILTSDKPIDIIMDPDNWLLAVINLKDE